MRFRNDKLGKEHSKWLRRIPEIYRFKGGIKESEQSQRTNNKLKEYELNSMLFPMLVTTIGHRDTLVSEMFAYVVETMNVTVEDLRTVALSHPFISLACPSPVWCATL